MKQEKDVTISDAGIKVVGVGHWNVFAGNISLAYGFDVKQGLVLEQFDNLAGHRPVHYNTGSTNWLPFEYAGEGPWVLESAEISEAGYGGRRTARLDLVISTFEVRLYFHAVAFPGTSIIRQWYDIENTAISHKSRFSIKPFRMNFALDDYKDTYQYTWFKGGKPRYDYGQICHEAIGVVADIHLHSQMHYSYVPMLLGLREQDPCDGFMVALDYCGTWDLNIKREQHGPVSVIFTLNEKESLTLLSNEKFELPVMTLGVFKESIDELMKDVYNWQYTYLWDYTNNDYYAKSRGPGWWVYNSRNLHEQFGYRLVNMNLQQGVLCQKAGCDMVWDDAGWSVYPGWPIDSYGSVFQNIYEGPDYRLSQRYFKKSGLRWCLWFAGQPTVGLLKSKEGSWGSFEWRTDGIEINDIREERDFKNKVKRFLEGNSNRSFHTCSGGSTYAHSFDIQRYANYNYSADIGAGPYGNYYLSYFEVPDKWGDILSWFGEKYLSKNGASNSGRPPGVLAKKKLEDELRYVPEFARARLGMVPLPGPMNTPTDVEASRKDFEIYRYLISQGVAGRWSYMFHPEVLGDKEFYYLQRTSPDFKRACIIFRHTPTKPVTVFPKNLLPDEPYQLGFQNTSETCTHSGRELMENGIRLENVQDGELIYLNLPNRPGSGMDKTPPEAPNQVVCRIETNIGNPGVGIYWLSGKDDNWISSYEISRNDKVIGRVSIGEYYFDFTDGWDVDAVYAVRTIDGDGNRSSWRKAQPIRGESPEYSALGGHSEIVGQNGWSAETSSDLKTFIPMTWIAPVNNPAGDLGGTPNQVGGIEGYWQGGTCARIGRGWQQASSDVYCARTYTVPKDGVIRVTGRAMKEWYHQNRGSDMRVCMLHNDHCVWGWADVKCGDLYGAAHDVRLQVNKGDTIRFVVDKSTGGDEDLLPWLERVNLVGWISRVVYENKTQQSAADKTSVLRINCGSKSMVTDDEGHMWSTDQYFSGGSAKSFRDDCDVETSLLATGRIGGNIVYDLPVAIGLYTVRLCFVEPINQWSGEREMDIEINGKSVARNFDIVAEGRGIWKKVEKFYNYIIPNAEGKIHICLKARKGDALIQAIEIAPEQRDVVRINCGSDQSFVDWAGDVWQADVHFDGGANIKADGEVVQATPTIYDQGLYLSGRAGNHIKYCIPVSSGIYSVHLKFAEVWFSTKGDRPMNIFINGRLMKKKWDPAQYAERLRMAADLRFEGISPVDGKINIAIDAVSDNPAVIQGIEVE